MGYRSSVTVAIYPDDRDQEKYATLKVLMGTTFKDAIAPFDEGCNWYDNKGVLVIEIGDVKWYDSFPDVQAFHQMLEDLTKGADGGIEGYNYEMIRLGEDDNDIDHSIGGEYTEGLLYVNREVVLGI